MTNPVWHGGRFSVLATKVPLFVLLRSLRVALSVSIFLALAILAAKAENYPTRPIKVVVPFAAGGGADALARILAKYLSDDFRQNVIIVNRPGADGAVAADDVASSSPDGYTLLMAVDPIMTMLPLLKTNSSYDPLKDFSPIALLASQSMLLVANSNLPVHDLRELVSYLRARSEKLNIGSSSINAQLFVKLLERATQTSLVYVPYRGSAQVVQAVVAGDIQLAVAESSPYVPYINQGQLRAIVTTGMPLPNLPRVPSVAAAGFPSIEIDTWQGLFAPAQTPAAIVQRINASVINVLKREDVNMQVEALGRTVTLSSPQELQARVASEYAKWKELIKSSGVVIE